MLKSALPIRELVQLTCCPGEQVSKLVWDKRSICIHGVLMPMQMKKIIITLLDIPHRMHNLKKRNTCVNSLIILEVNGTTY